MTKKKDKNPVKTVFCLVNDDGHILSGIPALHVFALDDNSRGFMFDEEKEAIDFLNKYLSILGGLASGLHPVQGICFGKKFLKTNNVIY